VVFLPILFLLFITTLIDLSELPSKEALPVTSPDNAIVLGVASLLAATAIPSLSSLPLIS